MLSKAGLSFALLLAYVFLFNKQSKAIPTDVGQIGFFESECPFGWKDYNNSAGRIIISKGEATDSRGETRSFKIGDQGGEFLHLLKLEEIPSHAHILTAFGRSGKYSTATNELNGDWGDMQHPTRSKLSSETGNNIAHNNVSPYIVLNACIKTSDFPIDVSVFAKKPDLEPYSTLQEIQLFKNELETLNKTYLVKSDLEALIMAKTYDLIKFTKNDDIKGLLDQAKSIEKNFYSSLPDLIVWKQNISLALIQIKDFYTDFNNSMVTKNWTLMNLITKEEYKTLFNDTNSNIVTKYEAFAVILVASFFSLLNLLIILKIILCR